MDELLFPHSRQRLSHVSQLAAAGVERGTYRRWYDDGDLVRIRRGVYSPCALPARGAYLLANGLVDLGYLAETRAVLLELSDQAVAGARTAALLWGYELLVEPDQVEIAVPHGAARRRKDFRLYTLDTLPRVLLRQRGLEPLAALSAVATVLHCAQVLPLREAVAIADSALRNKTVTRADLEQALRAERGKPYYLKQRTVLEWSDERAGSVLESAFRVLVLEAGLRRPASQVEVPAVGRVDFCWAAERLVVELDGRRWHESEAARRNDRLRDNALEVGGWRLLRFTWAQVVHDPDLVLDQVRAVLCGWLAA